MLMATGKRAAANLPGLALCLAVTLLATIMQKSEEFLLGRAWLESLVLAILAGAVIRTAWTPGERFHAGIHFSGKFLLEVAVVLLGAAVSARTVAAAGPSLLVGIVGVVVVAIAVSYGIGRGLGLPHRLAVLVACGNPICGNSAIAATAPVIGASSEDVAASIAFTALLGVIVVLSLPLLVPLLHISPAQYGVLAGLTVYAVPQMIAATAPVASLSVQVGTLVKLVRVLMLGPVVLTLALSSRQGSGHRPALHHLVPWFIVGFLATMAMRSFGVIPHAALAPMASIATALTVVSMAALGLGVDARVLVGAGGRVTGAVVLSLLALGGISLALIRMLGAL